MMKNKMFTRVLGMTCALIMAVTAIVPVCAKESGDQANSFRYENGQAAMQASTFADVYPNAWKKIAGKYRSSNGSIIQGAIARGIDVSHNQGVIDWQKVKADGVDFAIIRCGYGVNQREQDDRQWLDNVLECEKYGIPKTVFWNKRMTDSQFINLCCIIFSQINILSFRRVENNTSGRKLRKSGNRL